MESELNPLREVVKCRAFAWDHGMCEARVGFFTEIQYSPEARLYNDGNLVLVSESEVADHSANVGPLLDMLTAAGVEWQLDGASLWARRSKPGCASVKYKCDAYGGPSMVHALCRALIECTP